MTVKGPWLGVDYGSARVGIARSDPSGLLATPLEVHSSQGMEKDVEYVAKLAETLGAVGITVGLPLRLNGSQSLQTPDAAEFACRLKEACPLPVIAWDERFSTVEADKALKEAGFNGRRRAERVDKVAAALILQAYLDRQREPVLARPPAATAPETPSSKLPLRAIGLTTVVGILAILAFSTFWLMSPPRGARREVRFKVPVNATAKLVASALKKQHLIRNATFFCLFSRLKGVDDDFKAGVHVLDSSLSTTEIISSLALGDLRLKDIVVTIPEGYSLLQTAQVLQDSGVVPAHDFLAAAQGKAVAAGLVSFPVPEGSLEGYLFPDTYYFEPDSSPQAVAAKMLAAFEKKVYQSLPRDMALPRPLRSFHEALILASLVEREAKLPEERPLIAGVYLNRLRKGMKLECDATVQYALGRHKPRLLYSDLKINSPYNTYLHPSLPPGPICNPGLDSIRAALRPTESDYLYYVAQPDGSHTFSRSLAEHLAAGG